ECFGKPRCIRTDNESVFTSVLFRLGLRLLGIRHQLTAPFAPWQNGRVERFFKTFKELARQWPVGESPEPQKDLDLLRL
ncbi:MAG: transposase family protein, partial [bacterium]|nr:transposase family protein [bacterium]